MAAMLCQSRNLLCLAQPGSSAGFSTQGRNPPQIFPLADGGVQIEWYAAGDEIDIDVDRDGIVHVLATAQDGQPVIEGSADPQQPSELLNDLSEYVRGFSEWVAEERRRG
jgi:hypothetical protein